MKAAEHVITGAVVYNVNGMSSGQGTETFQDASLLCEDFAIGRCVINRYNGKLNYAVARTLERA